MPSLFQLPAASKGRLRKKEKSDVPSPTYLFLRFLKIFRSDLKNIFMVFLGSSCRETAKNAIKKIEGKRRQDFFSSQLFRPKVFDMDFPQKVFNVVFELPKGPAKKKSATPVVGGWVKVRKRDGVRFIFSIFCFIVFLNSPHREKPRNVI
jgi:hypothetical protein